MKRWLFLLLWLWPLCWGSAHRFSPTVITLYEESSGRFRCETVIPPDGAAMTPHFPPHCTLQTADSAREVSFGVLECGTVGLRGQSVSVSGAAYGEALLTIHFVDGNVFSGLLQKEPLLIPLPAMPRALHWTETIWRFGRLGFSHILAGADHLLLLLGFLGLAISLRALLLTVTAFTVGHSLTLALAAVELVRPPSRLVEALIALSVVFLARELVRPPQAVSVQRPALLAALFGLLHGLGFASALRESGLPEGQLLLSLGSFNVGVELGQLLFVLALALPVRALRRLQLTPVLGYGLGSLAMAWTVERTLQLLRIPS